jgi:hypothetical protein
MGVDTSVAIASGQLYCGQTGTAQFVAATTSADTTNFADFQASLGTVTTDYQVFWGRIFNSDTRIECGRDYSPHVPFVVDGTANALRANPNNLAIGATYYSSAIASPMLGDICEIVAYSTSLTRPQVREVLSYLRGRWGIAGVDQSAVHVGTFFQNTSATLNIRRGASASSITTNIAVVHTPPTGKEVRDPSIVWLNGKWYLVHTATTAGDTFGDSFGFASASSEDMVVWTNLATTNFSSSGYNRVWSPEIFVDSDGTIRIYFSVSSNGNTGPFSIAYVTTTDFVTFSSPVAVAGSALPTSIIDPFMVKRGSTYYLWYKNETTKYLGYLTSSSPTSGFNTDSGDLTTLGVNIEAPCLFLDGSTWYLYYDKYIANTGIHYRTSTDDWATWSSEVVVDTGTNERHGSWQQYAVTAPVATTLSVSPSSATVQASATQAFTAVCTDQYATPIVVSPTWSIVSGIGSVNSSTGLYTAPGATGVAVVRATSGSLTADANVTISLNYGRVVGSPIIRGKQ